MSRKLHSSDQPQQPRGEILAVAEAVAREKGISQEEVIAAMEMAIQKAAKAKYGQDHDIRAEVDRKSGEVTILRCMTVVDEVEDDMQQLLLEDARQEKADAEIGDVLTTELPPVAYDRIAAQSARQVISQKVREAERLHQYEEFKDRIGEVISGVIKRVEFGNLILDIGGRFETVLKRERMIPRERFNVGDRVRVFVEDVNPENRGHLITLSRVHNDFMAKLFTQEVPEIYDGVIEIKSVARDPGSRAKIAVYSNDPALDPVGACVGMRGVRVQAVVGELQGEKVDIVPWSENPATYVVNALAPAEVAKVVIDEEDHRVDVVVAEEQLSLAIGRRGQNVRLASQLTKWNIDILTEEQEMARRNEENSNRAKSFMEALDVDDIIGQVLASEGFMSVEEIAFVDLPELSNIEGFDEDIATEIQNRAKVYLEEKSNKLKKECEELKVQDDLRLFEGLELEHVVKLARDNVKNLDDFAGLSGDELLEIVGANAMSKDNANALIMKARESWFNDEK